MFQGLEHMSQILELIFHDLKHKISLKVKTSLTRTLITFLFNNSKKNKEKVFEFRYLFVILHRNSKEKQKYCSILTQIGTSE